MFTRVELWLVLALLLIEAVLAVGFAALVLRAERQTTPRSTLSSAALTIAEVPMTARDILRGQERLLAPDQAIFEGKPGGWSFPSGRATGPQGYLLVSRIDGDAGRDVTELVSMPDMTVRYRWTANHEAMLGMVRHRSPYDDTRDRSADLFRGIHPWLLADGDLIVKDHNSPLFRIDPCGRPQWVNDSRTFHHSTEADAEGNLWIPTTAERHSLPHVRHSFREDELTKVSPDGRILASHSVVQALLRNGYASWLFANETYLDDPLHLNDIEPVLADGPYWKKGDLFVSLRNVSAIMLYRPSTGEVVWIKRGPWLSQHDVDVLDDHRISIYDNHAQDFGTPGHSPHVEGTSRILVYDFATGRVSAPWNRAMAAEHVRTETAGLFTALPDGSALIEDSTDARLLNIRPDGRVAAEFVNRSAEGEVSILGWSRFVPRRRGDAILARLSRVDCAA